MKYIVRALKYFLYISVILTVILFLLSVFHFIGSTPEQIFRNGTDSIWQIAAMLAVFSAIYPKLGFGTRKVMVPGEFSELRPAILEVMDSCGYLPEKEEAQMLTFRRKNSFFRATRMWEDRITITPEFGGLEVEGLNRDTVRVVSALEYKFLQQS